MIYMTCARSPQTAWRARVDNSCRALAAKAQGERRVATMQFTVGLKANGKSDHTIVDADDALIAALKVKMQRPDAEILYVRRRQQEGGRAASGARAQEARPVKKSSEEEP
jgi:hypothetical protein